MSHLTSVFDPDVDPVTDASRDIYWSVWVLQADGSLQCTSILRSSESSPPNRDVSILMVSFRITNVLSLVCLSAPADAAVCTIKAMKQRLSPVSHSLTQITTLNPSTSSPGLTQQ